jgi:hypothetical protein
MQFVIWLQTRNEVKCSLEKKQILKLLHWFVIHRVRNMIALNKSLS